MSFIDDTVPARGAFAITASDSVDLARVTTGVYVGSTGNLKVTMENGDVVTFGSIVAGVVHPLRVKRVWSTGTTASSVIGVWGLGS